MSDCREYQGARDKDGYGVVYRQGRSFKLHRYVVAEIMGRIPAGHVVMHTCDNPSCFRFDHLRVATIRQNNADRAAKGRSFHPKGWAGPNLRGENHSQAKLTQAEVDQIRARVAAGEIQRRLAAEFGVSPATINLIKQGTTWKQS